ncbi:hypothetical protein DN752_17965 [Echinicola strongylocentroti]|uniref:Phosphohydrolase n=1 Tax=Echinicola strongylocentroti TaxID=1795355 RepID=A0A2Z4IMC4_9BACT|nr:hypothetical protein [Echinicola strongylocentroti]AWW31867.1 hypothetical protein DN752_17965 [Echinicola strongylocentroti]
MSKYLIWANSYVGNSLLFWRAGQAGYTTDIDKAHRFDFDEAKSICDGSGGEHKLIDARHLEEVSTRQVHADHFDRKRIGKEIPKADETLYAGSCILTYSGKYLNVFDPNPDDIVIEDIAHGLALECRFGNHLPVHYSVANHSIEVSNGLPNHLKLEGLLHDASEAYLGDMASPIKKSMPDYQRIEDGLMRAIADKFSFNYPLSKEVKIEDRKALEIEHITFREAKHAYKGKPFCIANQLDIREEFLRLFHIYSKMAGKEASHG